MSYYKLEDMESALSSAVTATQNINSFLMIELGELNGHHNLSYPLCMVEPPNSEVSNLNKAWERYDVVCYILNPESSSVENVLEYDNASFNFSEWMSNLMKQREGDYVLEKDSLTFERVRNIGNDRLIGIKASFNMLIPSVLSHDFSELPAALPSARDSAILGYWNLDDDGTSIEYDTTYKNRLSWNASGSSTMKLQSFGSNTPFLDKSGMSLIFSHGGVDGAYGVGLGSDDISSSSRDFSMFALISANKNEGVNNQTIFRISNDTPAGVDNGLVINPDSATLAFYFDDLLKGSMSTAPTYSKGQYRVVGVVVDSTAKTLTIYDGVNYESFPVGVTSSISRFKMSLGGFADPQNEEVLYDSTLNGNIKEFISYEANLSHAEVLEVQRFLISKLSN